MTNTTFIGTKLSGGQPANSTACVRGFDQVSYMIGTSASLFNVSDIPMYCWRIPNVMTFHSKF